MDPRACDIDAVELSHPGVQARRGRDRAMAQPEHAAKLLQIAPKTLRLAAEAGEIEAIHPLADGPWIFARAALTTSAAQSPNGHDRTRDTPRDHIPANKASSLQSHSKMGVLMRRCKSPSSGRSKCGPRIRFRRPADMPPRI